MIFDLVYETASIRMLSKKDQKYIQSLKVKKYRTREKRFLVEGEKNVSELLTSDFKIEMLVASQNFSKKISDHSDFRVEEVSDGILAQLGAFKTNNTAVAVVCQKEQESFKNREGEALFVLDGVGDPGNLGTIIRTLDWFGFTQLVCSRDCAELYNPKTIASTMGSFTRMDVYYIDLLPLLKSLDLPVYGADMNGQSIYKCELKAPAVFLMGSESHGISSDLLALVSKKIAIPKIGMAESLNVGIATGIVAGYLRRER